MQHRRNLVALVLAVSLLLTLCQAAQYERIDIDEIEDESMQDIVYEVVIRCKLTFEDDPASAKDILNALLFVEKKEEDGLWFKLTWETLYSKIVEITIHLKPDQTDDHLRFPPLQTPIQWKPAI